jgi:hypothetical protein
MDAGWIVATTVGACAVVAGLIVLVVYRVRARQAKRAAHQKWMNKVEDDLSRRRWDATDLNTLANRLGRLDERVTAIETAAYIAKAQATETR